MLVDEAIVTGAGEVLLHGALSRESQLLVERDGGGVVGGNAKLDSQDSSLAQDGEEFAHHAGAEALVLQLGRDCDSSQVNRMDEAVISPLDLGHSGGDSVHLEDTQVDRGEEIPVDRPELLEWHRVVGDEWTDRLVLVETVHELKVGFGGVPQHRRSG